MRFGYIESKLGTRYRHGSGYRVATIELKPDSSKKVSTSRYHEGVSSIGFYHFQKIHYEYFTTFLWARCK